MKNSHWLHAIAKRIKIKILHNPIYRQLNFRACYFQPIVHSSPVSAIKEVLIDTSGEWIVKPDFDNLESFVDGIARAKSAKGKWGFINEHGEWVIKPSFERVKNFSNGLATAQDDLWGYINDKGEWIIKPTLQPTESTHFNVSIPLAIVAAGLVLGNTTLGSKTSTQLQDYLHRVWKLIDELMNTVLFVMIGLQVVRMHFVDDYWVVGGLAISFSSSTVSPPVASSSSFPNDDATGGETVEEEK